MELQFDRQQQQGQGKGRASVGKFKGKSRGSSNNKFVGVRQRPSGKWVAEIKDTTQKIRMWLGTFDTAEEAARAYDEAACLLRGSNTRTNFITQVSSDSALSSRIRNLLNLKKGVKQHPLHAPSSTITNTTPSTSTIHTSMISNGGGSSSSCNNHSNGISLPFDDTKQVPKLFDDAYRPDLSSCTEEIELGSSQSNLSWASAPGINRLSFPQDGVDLSSSVGSVETKEPEIMEFERMKVERQISASLYAMNGVNEYFQTVHDPTEALWDLPPLCPLFYSV